MSSIKLLFFSVYVHGRRWVNAHFELYQMQLKDTGILHTTYRPLPRLFTPKPFYEIHHSNQSRVRLWNLPRWPNVPL